MCTDQPQEDNPPVCLHEQSSDDCVTGQWRVRLDKGTLERLHSVYSRYNWLPWAVLLPYASYAFRGGSCSTTSLTKGELQRSRTWQDLAEGARSGVVGARDSCELPCSCSAVVCPERLLTSGLLADVRDELHVCCNLALGARRYEQMEAAQHSSSFQWERLQGTRG